MELAVYYGIPIKRLVELFHEMHEEAQHRADKESGIGKSRSML